MSASREYVCWLCKGNFTKAWPDEAAEQEALELWGIDPAKNPNFFEVVCDPCFTHLGL